MTFYRKVSVTWHCCWRCDCCSQPLMKETWQCEAWSIHMSISPASLCLCISFQRQSSSLDELVFGSCFRSVGFWWGKLQTTWKIFSRGIAMLLALQLVVKHPQLTSLLRCAYVESLGFYSVGKEETLVFYAWFLIGLFKKWDEKGESACVCVCADKGGGIRRGSYSFYLYISIVACELQLFKTST